MSLIVDRAGAGAMQLVGLLAVLGATMAWAMDNTLSRALSARDPGQVVLAKSLLGATATGLLAAALREPLPGAAQGLALLGIGAAGYGLSLRLSCSRSVGFGAARTASVLRSPVRRRAGGSAAGREGRHGVDAPAAC